MSKLKITKTVFLKAPPSHVWKFLTKADRLAEWFHRADGDLKAGAGYELLSNVHDKQDEKLCWGDVLEMEPEKRLVHTFTHQWLNGAETTCTWTLEAVEGGTVLTLVHDGWEKVEENAFAMAADHDSGWDEHFGRLRRVTR